jgi:glycosyltransferase involved in cell wall biosynthesis
MTYDAKSRAAGKSHPTMSNQPSGTEPRVSVIIPAHNQESYLLATIQSVLAQTRPAHEIILVDDGSSDGTARVAQGYRAAGLTYLFQANQGPSAARNTGLRASHGEFVTLLDADDLWDPHFLETMVPLLAADPALGAVYCNSRYIDATGQPLNQVPYAQVPAPAQFLNELRWGNFLSIHAVLARRACVERAGLFDQTLRWSEDWDLWWRMAELNSFRGTPQALAKYRMHGRNRSGNTSREPAGWLAVVEKHCGPANGNPQDWSRSKRIAYCGVAVRTSAMYFETGDSAAAYDCLRRAFIFYPRVVDRFRVCYELACAHQPRGQRGDFARLDLAQTRGHTLAALDYVFRPPIPADLAAVRPQAYAQAHLTLALLAYGCRQPVAARAALHQARRYDPTLAWRSPWLATWLKSWVPSAWRRRWSGAKNPTSNVQR